ncbi:glutamine amidotransferas-like protein subunit pdxT [Plenodomus tracheiphilus IPT5]|uniref:glutaminase n=1 Tax=Plenodomus tracheiphilus IPT5 TaxID=1408161 RepID=A0A6A7B7M4_9PLEO|nr:glutamine amidotransferas-like protein subunit pdxT [Plenodomus tracheiphilus IPT5]
MTVPQPTPQAITVGVLALQGAFSEHIQLLRSASRQHPAYAFTLLEVRTPEQLSQCDALIIPGGESTTMSLVASRSNLLEPLRSFVKVLRRPTWGTCAGLILLAESANRTKKGGQDLVGGLDVRVRRNHFGRQQESFIRPLNLPFLEGGKADKKGEPYRCVFIRAPVVEKILPHRREGEQDGEKCLDDTVIAPSQTPGDELARQELNAEVEVMATLSADETQGEQEQGHEDIIAVRQGNVFGCSFHPELTDDARIHAWWLGEVARAVERRREFELVDRTKA